MNISFVELLKTAIYIEEQGYNFYMNMSKKTDNLNAKEIANFLADQELAHKENFMAILEKHTNVKKDLQTYFSDDDTTKYLSHILGAEIFSDLLEMNNSHKKSLSDKDCIEIAKTAEKNAYAFYKRIQDEFDDAETKQVIEEMAEEEEKHFLLLDNIK